MKVHYLEIVANDVDSLTGALEAVHQTSFGDPVAELGGARVAELPDGGLIGVRAPMRDDEDPVTRPYFLTDNIDAAVSKVEKQGAMIAMPPMEIPERGQFAIYIYEGAQIGLWQLP